MAETLKEKTAKGLFWGIMNNGTQQLLGLVFGIWLGRKLSDYDYGMTAMIVVFTLIANSLQDSGFRTAIANLKEATHRDYNSVFWFNVIVGTSLYVILFLAAPLIARYYHTPELVPLSRYAFLATIFASFGTAQTAYLFRNLMVKQTAQCNIIATMTASLVAVVMASLGFGYWALATQGVLYVAVNTLMLWHFSPWRPTFHLDFGPAMSMFRFSSKILLTYIINIINNNVLNVLLGYYYKPQAVGQYNQASQWNNKAGSVIQGMILQVAQPVLAGIDDDHERQLRALRKMVRFTAFLSFPLMFGLALVSHEFIIIAITEKWRESAYLLRMLCVAGAVAPLCTLFNNFIISKKRSDIYLWVTASLGVVQIVVMLLIWPYGIRVMVMVYVALQLLWFFIWYSQVARFLSYGLLMLLQDIMPFALAAAAVMAATFWLTLGIDNLWLLLGCRVLLAALLYYGIMRLAKVQILQECQDFLLKRFKKQHGQG